MKDLLPDNTYHHSYHSSLTTPPWTEGVEWIVLRDPIQFPQEQVQQFAAIISHNPRPIQPLHGRHLDEE